MKRAFGVAISLAALCFSVAAQASTITYYHNDLLGSPMVATDSSGKVIWRESYRPYGERLVNDAAGASNDLWYAGRRQDASTGLVYMGARYYDPVTGRFVSKDPVAFDEKNLQSFNRYAYANDNPYRYIDPAGRTPLDVGFALWDGGGFLGAVGAWAVGTATGDDALAAAGADGIRETRFDAGISASAIFLPISSGIAKGAIRSAEELADYARLQKKLASEAQMAEKGIAFAGAGTDTKIDTIERIIADHGGTADDWVKKSSSAFSASDGSKIETHWVENVNTGERVEFKTNLIK